MTVQISIEDEILMELADMVMGDKEYLAYCQFIADLLLEQEEVWVDYWYPDSFYCQGYM
jgi:hypothetical protein